MNFCVIGAGSGGRAFAAYLSSKGHSVSLYNRSYHRISAIQQKGGIEATGELKGFFPIQTVTQDLELAVRDAEIILVVTPAFAHKSIAKNIAPHLKEGQVIILNPGRTFGSVEFLREIDKVRGKFPVFIGETQTLLFTSRELPGNGVRILKIKNKVSFSTFPEKYIDLINDLLKNTFPQLISNENYLELTLNNIGMLLHPTISLFNAGPMDFGKTFKFYKEGATTRVCHVLEEVESEITEIFSVLGLKYMPFEKWAYKCYGIKANCIHDAIQQLEVYNNIKAPKELITRYFTEDVPTGLVPIASLASFLGIETPIIDSIIQLASVLCGINFLDRGRSIERLKIKDYLRERIFQATVLTDEFLSKERIRSTKEDM
ncbi:MAG: NADP transhydrogenase subunit alpha [Promethearchaeota archaeon]|nr:MAG: NADP transhydrogenase subunit alpha [Candidatus Lokiarchaeota archaeon]